ncbi:MAG: Smr/MutS family protein [Deltaproteobacteria bacterium]|nr:Smr/MutS family protein [Deltaproteobacteria bacterium]
MTSPPRRPLVPDDRVEFDLEEDGEEVLARWMEEGAMNPRDKFEGAREAGREVRRKLAGGAGDAGAAGVRDDEQPDDQLDLHGKTREEAIHMVQNFVMTSRQAGRGLVLIITGQGKHSGPQGPVLGETVFQWLRKNGGPYARSFGWAPPALGGNGAVWVRLKTNPAPRKPRGGKM